MTLTPADLSAIIGVDQKRIRDVLRDLYRPNGEDHGEQWNLTAEMVARVCVRLLK